jgi:pyruvate dehydrogenase E2 component (dihydrolipoamide acetyltransferase)
VDILVPKLSATMESAKVLRWLKTPGSAVASGEPIVELETDKTAIEVEAPVDGTLSVVAAEGDVLPIGALLATLTDGIGAPPPPLTAPRRIPASPLARRLARAHGVDLALIEGSGPLGRRRKRDVLRAAAAVPASAPTPAAASPPPTPESASGAVLSPMRQRVADAVSLSRRTIPAFSLDRWVETKAIGIARSTFADPIEQATGVRLTLTDFLLQAMADTLAGQPRMLERLSDHAGRLERVSPSSIDIGLVVATGDGIMIPVLRDLGGRTIGAIAALRQAAAQRARAGRLLATDAAPAAIALSNLGRSGADRFEAIINPGQTSILAVGREQERVIARAGAILVTKGANLTLSVDHRLIDGVVGAEFLGRLAERIERGPWSAD